MNYYIILGIFLPFIGTMIGVSTVFLLKKEIKPWLNHLLLGFSSGIMIAASIWSLIIPSIELTRSSIHASLGFGLGILFLLLVDFYTFKMDNKNTNMLMFSVTLHNIPEGMAVGVALAGLISSNPIITLASVLSLSLGIAIQNIPEGAIISLPLKSQGKSTIESLGYGFLSAVVEPIFAIITILLIKFVVPIMPYLLSFAAGAMCYVVINELIPESQAGKYKNIGTIGFMLGFIIMMVLDVALG